MSNKNQVAVCFTPANYPDFENNEAIVVVVDILRATSAIITALVNGADKIIPVGSLQDALLYKNKKYLVAGEREGVPLDFADFGNSPFEFTPDKVRGAEIVYTTTNGTKAINIAKGSRQVLLGGYLNHGALVNYLVKEDRSIIILCAGWKNKFSLEDSVYAGSLAESLLDNWNFTTECDSTFAAIDLWDMANENLISYIEKAAHRKRLTDIKSDDSVEYCHTFDKTNIIPVLQDNYLIDIHTTKK